MGSYGVLTYGIYPAGELGFCWSTERGEELSYLQNALQNALWVNSHLRAVGVPDPDIHPALFLSFSAKPAGKQTLWVYPDEQMLSLPSAGA